MNILLIHPLYPTTFWSFKFALEFISKKAMLPPLGLLTISAMLPSNWERKLADLNIAPLDSSDLEWADLVFISAMDIQRESVKRIITDCKKENCKIVAGGPLFTQYHEDFPQVDYLILGEAENTFPLFLEDLEKGNPKHIYGPSSYPDLTTTPVPDYRLLTLKNYSTLSIQYSRGCPYQCDFCEIPSLVGHKVRTKQTKQILDELELMYQLNWRGMVFFVDDNFIGNKRKLKTKLLPELIKWMKERNNPFEFMTETSIDLADDEELMDLMSESNFTSVFIGIETPEEKTLEECRKLQNNNRDMLESIRKINRKNFQVSAGFIIGFDSDTKTIFQRQIDFIQRSGIVTAMVGLLNAPRNTKLYERLHSENRLLSGFSGNNTDFTTNIIPKMDFRDLLSGYKRVLQGIYSVKPYYRRVRENLISCKGGFSRYGKFTLENLKAFFRCVYILGILEKGRAEFWRFLLWSLFRGFFHKAIAYAIYGYHFRKVYELRNQDNRVLTIQGSQA